MEIKLVSSDVFASTNTDKLKIFAVSNIKSIDGVVVDVVSLYAAKRYGSDVIIQTTEMQGAKNSTSYYAENIVTSDDDAIMLALNCV